MQIFTKVSISVLLVVVVDFLPTFLNNCKIEIYVLIREVNESLVLLLMLVYTFFNSVLPQFIQKFLSIKTFFNYHLEKYAYLMSLSLS